MNPFRTPLDPPPKARRLPFRPQRRPDLTIEQILEWCDAFHKRFGRWPKNKDGAQCLPDTTWAAVNTCLIKGLRGLPGGSSLSQLLATRRGVRNPAAPPRLERWEILFWADAHHDRTSRGPTAHSGPILEAPGETWSGVNAALQNGLRGLPGRESLARLLVRRRGKRNHMAQPRLSTEQILDWADAYHDRTGKWPTRQSGAIPEAPGETWSAAESALQRGWRGLPGGSSLAQLFAAERGVRNPAAVPPLSTVQILEWADAHHDRTSRWPTANSGPIPEAPGETWTAVQNALQRGYRGLPKGDSLARLLAQHRGKKNIQAPASLAVRQILAWADTHHARTGKWPTTHSGPIPESPFETWLAVDSALRAGRRGLRGGDSLPRLLTRTRGVRNHNAPPRLSIEQIRRWVRAHYRRTGCWPKRDDGPIPNTQHETWSTVRVALSRGLRGLPGGSSLAQVVATQKAKSPAK